MTRSTMAKMRKGAWSPAARAKAKATRAANREAKLNGKVSTKPSDALAYLLKAERLMLRGGLKRVGPVETLVFLALNSLRGEL